MQRSCGTGNLSNARTVTNADLPAGSTPPTNGLSAAQVSANAELSTRALRCWTSPRPPPREPWTLAAAMSRQWYWQPRLRTVRAGPWLWSSPAALASPERAAYDI